MNSFHPLSFPAAISGVGVGGRSLRLSEKLVVSQMYALVCVVSGFFCHLNKLPTSSPCLRSMAFPTSLTPPARVSIKPLSGAIYVYRFF